MAPPPAPPKAFKRHVRTQQKSQGCSCVPAPLQTKVRSDQIRSDQIHRGSRGPGLGLGLSLGEMRCACVRVPRLTYRVWRCVALRAPLHSHIPFAFPPPARAQECQKEWLAGPPFKPSRGPRSWDRLAELVASERYAVRCFPVCIFFLWWWGIKRGVVGAFDGVFLRDLGKRKLRNGEERHGCWVTCASKVWRGVASGEEFMLRYKSLPVPLQFFLLAP